MSPIYEPVDQMFLWILTDPQKPVLVGELNMVRNLRGVSLRYDSAWREHGFSLSEDLFLQSADEFFPVEKDTAAGAVDDARPDRWGERVIQILDKPSRLSLLEYLYFAGDNRFGALGVSLSQKRYQPSNNIPLPRLGDIQDLEEIIRKVLAHEPVSRQEKRLLSPGTSMGGARPKALLEIGGQEWVVKFASGEPIDTPLVEHASMTLAQQAGIRVAETKAIQTHFGHAVAVKRFDRTDNQRIHTLSAHVALRAADERYGYPELALLLRRRGIANDAYNIRQMQELFRRMIFNILIDNTDDHEKNHALLVNSQLEYSLSPAYDILPSGQALGYQQMRIGLQEADSTLDNAVSMCEAFALSKNEAQQEIARVVRVVDNWKTHFEELGVLPSDINMLSEQIDRPFLKNQRDSV